MKESFNQNMKNIGVGIAATVASVGIPKDAVSQQGILGKIKDKIKDKIEMVENRQQQVEVKQEVKKDSIIYNWEGDKDGFKYPFDKEYKSDEKFYRAVAYSRAHTLETAKEEAFMDAQHKLLTNEAGLTGNFEAKMGNTSIIDEKFFEDKEGIITCVVALEIERENVIVIKKSEPIGGILENNSVKSTNIETEKTKNEKFGENISGEWKEYKVEKPEEPPIGDKPIKQPVYNPTQKVEKSDYHVTFEDFKKVQESEFESYKKSQEEEFNKFKEGK